jgi:hypothetical protein
MEISNSGEKWNNKFFRIMNSAMCFGIAYIFLITGNFITQGLVAKMYSIEGKITFYGIHYTSDLKEWYKKNSVIVHSSGLIFIFLVSIVSWALFNKTSKFNSPLRLIFLWIYMIGVCYFSAKFMSAALGISDTNSPFTVDFAFAIAWLYIKPAIAFMLASLMFIVMVAAMFFLIKPFLTLSYSYRKVYKLKARRKYFFETAMLPSFIGLLFSTTLIFPENYIFIHFVQSFYILIAMVVSWYLLFYVDIDYDSVSRHTGLEKVNFTLILLFVLATVFTQTILDKGIKF